MISNDTHPISEHIPKPKKITPLLVLIAALLILALCGIAFKKFFGGINPSPGETLSSNFLGHECSIIVNQGPGEAAIQHALKELNVLENRIDWNDPASEISAVNRMAGVSPVAVSADTFDLVAKAKEFAAATSGIFDPTAGALFALWGFSETGSTPQNVPPSTDIEKAIKTVGYQGIILYPDRQLVGLKKPGAKLNLSQIVMGYAVTKARSDLLKQGVESAKVTIGNVISVVGREREGVDWSIPISDPRREGHILGYITLPPGGAMATATDHDRAFSVADKTYHDILNPKTGYPALDCMSVTVIGGDAASIDALSSAIFIMGPQKGMETIDSLKEVQGLIVKKDGTILKSGGLTLNEGAVNP